MDRFARDAVPAPLARWIPAGTELVFPEQGMTSVVAFVVPDGPVLKRCVDPIYLDWLRRECDVLTALHASDLPVPHRLDDLDLGDEIWLVMTRLPGVSASGELARASAAERRELLARVGAFLRRLHATPSPASFDDTQPWIDRRLAAARRNLAWCDGSAALLDRLEATRPSAIAPALVHGDFNLENLLVERGEVTGLVDWAAGDFGDPRVDVALALQPDEDLPLDAGDLDAFFAAYGEPVDPATRVWFEELYEFF